MDYLTIKVVHQCAVALSLTGFVVRGIASLSGALWVQSAAAKTFPHVIDTALLASAVALAWTARLNPVETPWLLAKLMGLVVYVSLGTVALKARYRRRTRISAFVGALMTAGWMVSVAIEKRPLGFFVL